MMMVVVMMMEIGPRDDTIIPVMVMVVMMVVVMVKILRELHRLLLGCARAEAGVVRLEHI